jgi:dATP pyrophosphohydrolase
VYTAAGSTLLLERRTPVAFWQSVTGSLEEGESAGAAAVRELYEETGLAAHGLRDLHSRGTFPIAAPWRARYAPEVTLNVEHYFALRLEREAAIRIAAHEHVGYEWLPFADAIARVSSPSNRELIERIAREAAA